MNECIGDRGLRVGLGAFLATLVVLIPLGSEPAQAKGCRDVILGNGWRWVVGGDDRLSCSTMRYWTRSMVKGKGRPKGWKCNKRGSGPSQSGGCTRGSGSNYRFFIYYPPH